MDAYFLAAAIVVWPTWHVPCADGTPHAVSCTTRHVDSCTIDVGQHYQGLTPLCRDLVLAHEARHCVHPHEHGPVGGGTLSACLGGPDLSEWIR